MMKIYKTNSLRQTKKIAADLAKKFLKKNFKNALVFGLQGDLGSGKTTFVQGFLKSLGIRRKITSPTFVIIKCYMLHAARFRNVYHIDCYRVQKPNDLLLLGLKEILKNPQNVVLIEWAERIKKFLPKNTIWLKFEHGEKENQRIIKLSKISA